MAFLKKFVNNIKNAFSEAAQDIKTDVANKKETKQNNSVQQEPQTTERVEAQPITESVTQSTSQSAIPQNSTCTPSTQRINLPNALSAEDGELIQHDPINSDSMTLESLVYALELDANKIIIDSNIITIPLDASGCDFETKQQLTNAFATEYQLTLNKPSEESLRNLSRRIFSSIRNNKEESFVSGHIFISVNQDIDDEGFMIAEVTNVQNGQSVLFDIPAASSPNGDILVDCELIAMNLRVACERLN